MKKLLLFIVLLLAVGAAMFIIAPQYIQPFLPKKAQQQVGTLINKVAGDAGTLQVQGQRLREAFLRKHSLGFAVKKITLDDVAPAGILAEPAMFKPAPLHGYQFTNGSAPKATTPQDIHWQLGGATGLTTEDTYSPDYYAFIPGIAASACDASTALMTDQPIAPSAFADKTATLQFTSPLTRENLVERSHGCVASTEGDFIYYQLLYGQGLKSQRLQ